MAADADRDPRWRGLETPLELHRWGFFIGMGALLVVNLFVGTGWWTFWPMMLWSVIFGIHLCVVRSLNVDDDWAEERADQLLDKSYDFGHMRDISHRVVNRDSSVQIAEERDD